MEVDLVIDDGATVWLVEAKSGATVASDWFPPLRHAADQLAADRPGAVVRTAIVYGGDEPQQRMGVEVLPWHLIERLAPAA